MNRKQFLAVIGAVISAPFIKKEKRVWKTYTNTTVTEASDGTFLIVGEGQSWAKGRATVRGVQGQIYKDWLRDNPDYYKNLYTGYFEDPQV